MWGQSRIPTRKLSKADLEALTCFRYRLRRFLRFTKVVSHCNAVTPMQYRLLLQIKSCPGREGSTVPQLSERLQIKHHSVAALISRCEAARLVSRSATRSDVRCVEVRLSPAGQSYLEHLARSKRDESRTTGCFFAVVVDDDRHSKLNHDEDIMNLRLPGHRAPVVGFEVPLEMLSACHSRIEQQCATLRRLGPHLARHGADDRARTAATSVMRYIRNRGGASPCRRRAGPVSRSGRVDGRLRRGLPASVDDRTGDVEALVGLYERHIEREENELLPMAARLLGSAELGRMGRAMRERRGIVPG